MLAAQEGEQDWTGSGYASVVAHSHGGEGGGRGECLDWSLLCCSTSVWQTVV